LGEEMGEGTRERGVSDFLKLTDGSFISFWRYWMREGSSRGP
jgi:hypothetical protein